jgi:hypothetical protein
MAGENTLLKVQVRREEHGNKGLQLPFDDLQRVQELVQVLAHAKVEDLLVEIRFGDGDRVEPTEPSGLESENGKVEEEELEAVPNPAKYTYG